MKTRLPVRPVGAAFTMVEVMMAVGIFAMILASIYATWSSVNRGTRVGLKAAADAQRERMTRKCIEDALTTYQGFASSNYLIDVGQDGDFAYLSLVAKLPESFPGSALFGGQALRRVSFWVAKDEKLGVNRVYMSQFPPLLATNDTVEPYVIPLATDVSAFEIQFWDEQEGAFFPPEPGPTNAMPKQIQVALAFGGQVRGQDVRVMTSIIAPPSVAVTADMQTPTPAAVAGGRRNGQVGNGGNRQGQPGQPGPPGQGGNGGGRMRPGNGGGGQGGGFNNPGIRPPNRGGGGGGR